MNRSAANERLNGRLISRISLIIHRSMISAELSAANDQTLDDRWTQVKINAGKRRETTPISRLSGPPSREFRSFYSLPLRRIPRFFLFRSFGSVGTTITSRQVPFLGIFRVKVHSSASIFSSKVIEWIHTTWIPVDCAWNGLQFFYLELFDWTKRLTVNSRNIFHDHQTFSSFCGRTFDYIGLNWKDDL